MEFAKKYTRRAAPLGVPSLIGRQSTGYQFTHCRLPTGHSATTMLCEDKVVCTVTVSGSVGEVTAGLGILAKRLQSALH
jgi:hypothetical protein